MKNTIIISIILLIIIKLEYSVKKTYLGIIILHNNDHTLNKILQNIMNLMNSHLIHYQILVIKESNQKEITNKRSTGYLFNIGKRHLSGFGNYLFVDTIYCKIKNFYSIHSSKNIDMEKLFVKDSINYFESICSIAISKQLFKSIDGFTNKTNNSFNQFVENLNKGKNKYGGYFSMNLDVKYDIIDRTTINSLTNRITIKYN